MNPLSDIELKISLLFRLQIIFHFFNLRQFPLSWLSLSSNSSPSPVSITLINYLLSLYDFHSLDLSISLWTHRLLLRARLNSIVVKV
jgi:hypothetical protein